MYKHWWLWVLQIETNYRLNAKDSNNTLKYLFEGNAFRNEVENEDAQPDERDVEDSPVLADENDSEDESNDLALAKNSKGINLFFFLISNCMR